MGKSLVIKNADFSANKCGTIATSRSGSFLMLQSGLQLATTKNTHGRWAPTTAFSNYSKRITFCDADYIPLFVPKGATCVISGIMGLKLDYACFDRKHDIRKWEYYAGNKVYQDGVPYNLTEYSDGEVLYEYLVTSGMRQNGGSSSSAYLVTDGTVDSYTFTNNLDGEWFVFCAKDASNGAIEASDFEIGFEVRM